jgi:glutamate-5-semialdehyde dehydrogenase
VGLVRVVALHEREQAHRPRECAADRHHERELSHDVTWAILPATRCQPQRRGFAAVGDEHLALVAGDASDGTPERGASALAPSLIGLDEDHHRIVVERAREHVADGRVVGLGSGPDGRHEREVTLDAMKAGARVADLARRARDASRTLATASTAQKDAALHDAADLLDERSGDIVSANSLDVDRETAAGVSPTVVDRLRLDERRVANMAGGLRKVAALADPIGEVTEGWTRPNGMRIERVRVPLGVVAIIYENRPNVTSDAFALCLKSGNATLLRGSSAAIESNVAIASVLGEALRKNGLPDDGVALVEDTSREAAIELMRQRQWVDCLVPRGGPALIQSILDNATVPYVIDGDGNCHVYVDADADLDMAVSIVVNAKTQRPSVCNAAETLLVHQDVAADFLPRVAPSLDGVELRGDEQTRAVLGADRVVEATEADFATEFLDLVLAVRVVPSLDAAIDHITRFGSGHSEAIVTGDLRAADRFTREVDAAAVLVNASTRFVDGEEFGFGAEIGISTQKLHTRGPMGLRELTTLKYVVRGEGHIRT